MNAIPVHCANCPPSPQHSVHVQTESVSTMLWNPRRSSATGQSAAEESACQERLHVAPPIRNEIDDHLLSDHAIDDAIGLKKNLPIFLISQGPKFLGLRASSRLGCKAIRNVEYAAEHVLCIALRVVLR